MKKSQADATTARNLEEKFDRAENVLDYFEVPESAHHRSAIQKVKRQNKVSLSGKAKCQTRRGRSREIRALSQKDWVAHASRLWQSASSRNDFRFLQRIRLHHKRLMMHYWIDQ